MLQSLPHNGRPRLLVPLDSRPDPVYSFSDTGSGQCADRQHPGVSDAGSLVTLKDLLDEPLLYPDDLEAVFAVLFIGEDEQRHTFCLGVLQLVFDI